MHKNREIFHLEKLKAYSGNYSKYNVISNIFTLVTFGLLSITFIVTSKSLVPLKFGLVSMAVLGIIGGAIFSYQQMKIKIDFQQQYIDKERVDARIKELRASQ